jgi:hypothetical protein
LHFQYGAGRLQPTEARRKPELHAGPEPRIAVVLLTKQKLRQDRYFHSDTEPDHPFQQNKVGLNPDQAAFDPGKC